MNSSADRALLGLLQLADSALPIGTAAHSFGLEGLLDCQSIPVAQLGVILEAYLEETAVQEASYCMSACEGPSLPEWRLLNRALSALKPAREVRMASTTMGKRMLILAQTFGMVEEGQWLNAGIVHHCAVFGLIAGRLGVDSDKAAAVYIHQNVAALVSAAQRLLPVGQVAAATLLWNLKDRIIACIEEAKRFEGGCATSFNPLLDIGSMTHPWMGTRLFVS